MKKLLALLCLMPMVVMAQVNYGKLPPLHVEGNQLKDSYGNTVVLHGVMDTPSPYFNNYRWISWGQPLGEHINDCLTYFNKLFAGLTNHDDGAFCNVFRLHMDPCWVGDGALAKGFTKTSDGKTLDPHGNEVGGEANVGNFVLSKYKTYLKSVYTKLAINAMKHGLYVVVRPPGVCPGYIEVGDYYNDYLMTIWDEFSKNDSIRKYSGQIAIELANEPVTLKNAKGQSDPKALHDFFQPIVDKIRSNGYSGIIYAPGTGWQSNYRDYAQYPIEGANIGYAVHDYVGWYDTNDDHCDANNKIKKFQEAVPVVATNPIIITEVDWSPKKPGTGHYNEHGEWVESNYGTWATGSTSKWGKAYKAMMDHFGNISMTLSGTHCYLDVDKLLSTGHSYPAFDGLEEASGKACFDWYADYAKVNYAHPAFSRTWTADQGFGKFYNPIINADFPDCDVIRVDDTYYLVSTTMYIFPGCTLLKSKDLVNWEYCANPLLQIDDNDAYNLLNGKDHYSQGQWAASLNYHDGKFYIYFISYGRDGVDQGRNVMLTATDPEGTWNMEYWPEHYYDSGWLFDDGANGDGNVYVACGIGDIWVNKLDPKTLKKISSTKVINARDGLEGSHMYHIGDWYYLYLTTGGYWKGQTIYRSKNPMGPYEEMPNLNGYENALAGNAFSGQGIHQGALVETQTGEWWTIMFKDAGPIGRVPYLEPVTWQDGWPIIGNKGVDVTKGVKLYKNPDVGGSHPRTYLPTNDTFTELTLGKQWGWNHNPDNAAWSLIEHPGWLRLHTVNVASELNRARNSLTQRILGYHPEGQTNAKIPWNYGTIKMDASHMTEGDVAGISVFQDPYSYIGVTVKNGVKRLVYYHSSYDDNAAVTEYGSELESDIIFLRARSHFGNNTCTYYYSYDNENWIRFGGTMNMRYTLRYFVGQRYYIFNYATKDLGGYVDIDWFSTEPEYSEEMYYSEGILNSFTIEDATAKELVIDQDEYYLMPGNPSNFAITATMLSGMKNNVTTGCTFQVANPSICRIVGNRIIGVNLGSTTITATYTDPAGGSLSLEFKVNVSYFPVAVGAIDPSIIGTGTFKMHSSGEYGLLKLQAKGFGGWHYANGIDITGHGRYLVVNLAATSMARPILKLYDVDDPKSESCYTVEMGTSMKSVVLDLEEVGKQIDLTHIYYIGFSCMQSSNICVKEVFWSNDGETDGIESIEAEPQAAETVRVEFYTMDGRRHQGLQPGANIVRRIYSDGRVEAAKVIK